MVGWYADFTSDEANLKALQDSGVKYGRWNAENDARTCDVCNERAGKIYPIDRIPPKPHPGCRCWITGASKADYEKQRNK